MTMKVTIRNTDNYAMHILVTVLLHKKRPTLLWLMINHEGVVISVGFTGHIHVKRK